VHQIDVKIEICIITVSTSRYEKYGFVKGKMNIPEDDRSGKLIREEFVNLVKDYFLIPDDVESIRKTVFGTDCNVIIITGGTGLNPKDVTIEAIRSVFDREIDGFGEIFRLESLKEIGYSAMLSRATAGIIGKKVVFCLPGSERAVKLGVRIIKEVLGHVVTHVSGLR